MRSWVAIEGDFSDTVGSGREVVTLRLRLSWIGGWWWWALSSRSTRRGHGPKVTPTQPVSHHEERDREVQQRQGEAATTILTRELGV